MAKERNRKIIYDYSKLRGKIKEVFNTQKAFAVAMNMDFVSINQRLNNIVDWKTSDITRACALLGIPLVEVYRYFFVEKI